MEMNIPGMGQFQMNYASYNEILQDSVFYEEDEEFHPANFNTEDILED